MRWAFVAIKVFVANVIKNYEIIAGEETPQIDKIELEFVGTQVKTTKPMNIRFKKRSWIDFNKNFLPKIDNLFNIGEKALEMELKRKYFEINKIVAGFWER